MSSMEDFLQTQEQIASAIEQVFTNFKKDGSDRKTATYIKQRLEMLDSYWLEYQSNHVKLSGFEDRSHYYFTSKRYEIVKDRFSNIRATIQNYQPRDEGGRPSTPLLKPATPIGAPSSHQVLENSSSRSLGTNSRTDEMLRKQTSHFKAFEHTISNINISKVSEKWEFDHLLRVIQSRWSAIDALHWELDSELNGREPEYEATYFNFERKYNEVIKSINQKLWSVSHREQSTPHLEIPTFNGSYHQWTSFKDLFMETIHNNPTLSSAQRMQFLKSKVRGEAERLIQHLTISSDNYLVCWDILTHRYDNKKLILNSHLDILFAIPVMHQATVNHLKRIHDTAQETLNAIKNLGITVDSWDPLLVYILCQKLDSETHGEYVASVKQPREVPKISEFLSFLENKFTTMESSRRKQENQNKSITRNPVYNAPSFSYTKYQKPSNNYSYVKQSFPPQGRHVSQSFYNNKNVYATKYYKCPICKSDDHGVFCCKQFLEMSAWSKRKTISKYNICQNCLYCHYGKACISDKKCRECNQAHNTLLHEAFTQSSSDHSSGATTSRKYTNEASPPAPETSHNIRSNSHVSLHQEVPEILLATAIIKVKSFNGSYIKLRALLDQGSQASLITENAAQQLGLPRSKCQGVISGIGANENNCKGMLHIQISSINNDFEFETNVLIINNLIKNLPSQSFSKPTWPYLHNITLADPDFNSSRPIDLLLGADIYSLILLEGICRANQDSPIAQNTRLGWILSGNVRTLQCNVILNDLVDIQRFWQIEDITLEKELSTEDQQCIDYYQSTTTRRDDGRYEVRIPFKPNFEQSLGDSKSKAFAQFRSLEKKFNKNESMEKHYKSFMQEYISLGHMIPVTDNSIPGCYLTHHGIERTESETTKFRVVFNASSPTSSGCSLNDVMLSGPNLQQDLQTLIIKWRQYQFAFTADCEKMFRQIWVNIKDQIYQKIIWRDSTYQSFQEYQLATVTYGTKAAPFLAMMTLKQLAADERSKYSNSMYQDQAPDVLEHSCYMDDLVHGAHCVTSAKKLCNDLITLLKSGGFNLRKWRSNIADIRELNNESPSQCQSEESIKKLECSKTLGLNWNPHLDTFLFDTKIYQTSSKPDTKRALLSDISKLFDPLGWLAPLSTKLKIIFQSVWTADIKWDDQLPEKIQTEWTNIKQDIRKHMGDLKIERWIGTKQGDTIELHGFCDASLKAYACVIYCVIKRADNTTISLFVAKSRLVPSKSKVSLPKLELSGALLLSKLMQKVKQCLNNYNIKIYGWSDSMIVLGWLNGDPARWKSFVSNRVKEICYVMPSERWRYVKSEENPADCASRGLNVSQLSAHTLWWKGPSWLATFVDQDKQISYVTDLEIKNTKQVNVLTEQNLENNIIQSLLLKYSSFMKVVRIIAWLLRLSSKQQTKQKYLTLSELTRSRNKIIRHAQKVHFSKELDCIRTGSKMPSNSKLCQLNPFLDKEEVLRVGGRLRNAAISPERKHPIIIPKNCRLAELLVDQAHKLTFHGGARLTSAFLRHKYWILGGNRAVKKQLRLCVTCRYHKPIMHNQLMGDLPASRTTPSRPFHHTGVDLTGFVLVKSSKGRGIKSTKGYIVVFVCMATKAVHLELVSDLTSSSFLSALRRMAARRGAPRHLYSDNGTNFVGASRTLHQEYLDLQTTLDDNFFTAITEMEIQWHFNAPSWPSAGGLWEAAVKSLKYHLKRIIGEQKLTFEEYSTLLSQLEACLNSRPLCALTEDCEDLDYLTPAHFLASGPTLTIIETEKDQRTRWQLTQKIFDDIWRRWQNEYLGQLSARSKWRETKENFKVDDIVIIHDANLPPGKWALGRVVTLHPGKDDLVRVVTLKTKNGFVKRPITKISLLPTSKDDESIERKSEPKVIISSATLNESRSQRTYSCKQSFLFSIFMWLILITVAPVYATHQISSLNNNHGFYFDKIGNMRLEQDQWKLIIYYDMSPYWQGTTLLNTFIKHLDEVCFNHDNRKIAQCDLILLQLHHGLIELEHYNGILLGQQFTRRSARTRLRRGLINGVGAIAHSLFGVLDENFAEQYERDILTIRDNQNHLALLWKNQTSIVEAEFNLIKRMETSIDKQHKAFIQHLNALEAEISGQEVALQFGLKVNDFTLSSVIATGVLSSLKTIQETLVTSVTDIYLGKFNFHLLTPDQLRSELNIITGQLSKDLTLPLNDIQSDLTKIYHLLTVKARALKNFIIFEVNIPLVTRDNFDIYKLIPIPLKVNNNMIQLIPISSYVAINIRKDSFIPMVEENRQECVKYDADIYICPLKQPVHQMRSDESLCIKNNLSDQCETTTSVCHNIWMSLSNINTYLFFCCGQCTVRIICESQVTAEQLLMSGLITLSNDCIIKGDSFTVYPHKTFSNTLENKADIIKFDIPPINNIMNITIHKPLIETPDNITNPIDLETIDRQIQNLKTAASEGILTDRVSYHDVHHYVAIYVVGLGSVITFAVVIFRRRWCRRPGRAREEPQPPSAQASTSAGHPQKTVQCVSDSAVQCTNQCGNVNIEMCDLKANNSVSEISKPGLSSARVVDSATSPIFYRDFSSL